MISLTCWEKHKQLQSNPNVSFERSLFSGSLEINRKPRQLHVVYAWLDDVRKFQEVNDTYETVIHQKLSIIRDSVQSDSSLISASHLSNKRDRLLSMNRNCMFWWAKTDALTQLMSKWRLPGMIFQLTHWQMIRLAVIETRALAGIVMPALICSDWESSAQDWEHWPRRRVEASYRRQKWNACKLLLRHLSETVHSLCSCIRKSDIQSSVCLNAWKKL